ncbi:MAG: aminotransferase class I/II-fold pyridoxal phosphate-dependent enzyme [Cyanobacteria bacterium]|nr:aminotransferase class I/II-fold pyridoxal phosphate-dependent enzyme [Cyanobacteriota bacterium]
MAGTVSRRKFFGTAAATVGVLGMTKSPELYAQALAGTQRFGGNDADYDRMIKLASNENNWGPPKAVMDAMNGAWKYANRYGYPDGNVVEAIAEHHGLKPENVLLTAGSGEVLQVVGTTFLSGGKKVIGADPSYGSVYQHATNIKADAIKLPLLKDYRQDIPGMIDATNKRAAEIGFFYLCNPNNPTGVVVTAKEVDQVVKGIPKDMPILIDEAYHHFVDDPAYGTATPYILEGRPVIVARTFSKIAALAAMRIGYALAPAEIVRKMRPYSMGSVNALAKWGAVASLKDTAGQAEVRKKVIDLRHKTTRELEAHGYPTIPSQTNFFMVSLEGRTVQPVIQQFREKGILVGRPFPPMINHLRVSIGTAEDMAKFVSTFKELFPKKATTNTAAQR